MQRAKYMQKQNNKYGISMQNEPYFAEGPDRLYPDMKKTYMAFSERFDLSQDNFILTNGCENALRIAMLATKTNSISIEHPTWGLAEVIATSFGIKVNHIDFKKKDNIFTAENKINGLVYTTDKYNNFIKHEDIRGDITILDETYTLNSLMNSDRVFDVNTIIIGSFSKFVSPGIRIGYILFDKTWSSRMNMLREQYISSAASRMLISQDYTLRQPEIPKINIPYEIVSQHPTYITVAADTLPIPHKKIMIDGKSYCRFGIVKDMHEICEALNG